MAPREERFLPAHVSSSGVVIQTNAAHGAERWKEWGAVVGEP